MEYFFILKSLGTTGEDGTIFLYKSTYWVGGCIPVSPIQWNYYSYWNIMNQYNCDIIVIL